MDLHTGSPISYSQFHALWTLPLLGVLLLALRLRASWPPGSAAPHYSTVTSAPSDVSVGLPWFCVLCCVAFAYTTPWDAWLIARGVWASTEVAGTALGIPWEEYAFFLLATAISCVCWALCWPAQWSDVTAARPSRLVTLGLCSLIGAGLVAMTSAQRTLYLGSLLLWAAPVLLLQWGVGGHVLSAHAGPLCRSILLSGGTMAIIDVWAIQRNIWVLNPEHSLWPWARGLHPEEVLFFFLSSTMCIWGLALAVWVGKGHSPHLLPQGMQAALQVRQVPVQVPSSGSSSSCSSSGSNSNSGDNGEGSGAAALPARGRSRAASKSAGSSSSSRKSKLQ